MELIEVTYRSTKRQSDRSPSAHWPSPWPKVGETVDARCCCREIRLGSSSYRKGEIVEGWNTDTHELERWECVTPVGAHLLNIRPAKMKRLK